MIEMEDMLKIRTKRRTSTLTKIAFIGWNGTWWEGCEDEIKSKWTRLQGQQPLQGYQKMHEQLGLQGEGS
jgi:hypothetical protein